jgi:C-22 sterol desaturase
MVIPSFWDSTHDATSYPEPDKFIPERWIPKEDGEQVLADKYPQNYMVWGSGPHKVGREPSFMYKNWERG